MTWGIDDVDLRIFVKYCRIFGKDGNTSFSFNIIGVHDAFLNFLVGAEYAGLF